MCVWHLDMHFVSYEDRSMMILQGYKDLDTSKCSPASPEDYVFTGQFTTASVSFYYRQQEQLERILLDVHVRTNHASFTLKLYSVLDPGHTWPATTNRH